MHGVIGGPKTLAQWQDYLDALHAPFDAADEALRRFAGRAGHASTPGYTDPQYPVTGRQPRARLTPRHGCAQSAGDKDRGRPQSLTACGERFSYQCVMRAPSQWSARCAAALAWRSARGRKMPTHSPPAWRTLG